MYYRATTVNETYYLLKLIDEGFFIYELETLGVIMVSDLNVHRGENSSEFQASMNSSTTTVNLSLEVANLSR